MHFLFTKMDSLSFGGAELMQILHVFHPQESGFAVSMWNVVTQV